MKEWNKTKTPNLVMRDTGVYYVQVVVNGKQFRRSLRTKKMSIAKLKLGKELIKIRAIKYTDNGDTLAESLNQWWTSKKLERELQPETLKYWEKGMKFVMSRLDGSVKLSSSAAIKWWVDDLRDVVSNNYANNLLSMMKATMQLEVEAGFRSDNPLANIKRLKVEVPELNLPSRSQFKKIVKHVRSVKKWSAEESADMLEWIAYSGMRRGEVNALVWDDVHKKEIVVRGRKIESKGNRAGTKSGKIRRIPVSKSLKKVITRRKKARVDDRVFTITSPKKGLKKACEVVNCGHLTPHDLRHLFATVCIESGVDIFTVAKWLGHQDGGVLAMKTYGHLRDEHSQEQMKGVQF